MYSIDASHALQGEDVFQRPTQNHNANISPKFLVFHYTACDAVTAINTFLRSTGSNRTSAHLVVDRDGSVTQMVRFNRRAWHAGESQWMGFNDLNTHSIGIEVVNLGYLQRFADGTFRPKLGGSPVPASDVVEARHKLPAEHHRYWQAYTTQQLDTCQALATALVERYGLRDIVGHDDIAPARKVDPGPAFPLASIRGAAFGRMDDGAPQSELCEVTASLLNVRSGPGLGFERLGSPLPRGTRVRPLGEDVLPWRFIEAVGAAASQGWVNATYLRAV